jgi:hypothetical protein
MSVVPAIGRQRQEDLELEVALYSLGLHRPNKQTKLLIHLPWITSPRPHPPSAVSLSPEGLSARSSSAWDLGLCFLSCKKTQTYQAALELLGSSDPPASVSRVTGTTDALPCSASFLLFIEHLCVSTLVPDVTPRDQKRPHSPRGQKAKVEVSAGLHSPRLWDRLHSQPLPAFGALPAFLGAWPYY